MNSWLRANRPDYVHLSNVKQLCTHVIKIFSNLYMCSRYFLKNASVEHYFFGQEMQDV